MRGVQRFYRSRILTHSLSPWTPITEPRAPGIMDGTERKLKTNEDHKCSFKSYSCGGTKANLILRRSYISEYSMLLRKPASYSSTAKVEEDKSHETVAEPKMKTLEDFQHEEIVGPTVERDLSPVADELRKTHMEIREVISKFSKSILAVGVVHLVWGGMMFRVVDPPFSHALLTQVCLSSFVLFGLSYYSRQTLKPIEFFMKLEERSRLRMITLSLQVAKTLSAFFQRSYGINLALSLALTANLLGCLKFFSF